MTAKQKRMQRLWLVDNIVLPGTALLLLALAIVLSMRSEPVQPLFKLKIVAERVLAPPHVPTFKLSIEVC